jgi:AcrR family transcriptional regulator
MASTADRRVRRTRAALTGALMALMVEKDYASITVQDLIDRADVGRSTFYAHFTDKSDLLHEALSGLQAVLEPGPGAPSGDPRRPLRFSGEMFRHVRDQRALLRSLFRRPGGDEVIAEIEQVLVKVVQGELEALAIPEGTTRVPVDLLARGVVGAYLATLSWWVANGFDQTPAQMTEFFETMVGPGVKTALALR